MQHNEEVQCILRDPSCVGLSAVQRGCRGMSGVFVGHVSLIMDVPSRLSCQCDEPETIFSRKFCAVGVASHVIVFVRIEQQAGSS